MNIRQKIHQEPTVVNPLANESALFKQKHPKAYLQKNRPLSEFTMTKRILELKDNDGKNIHMQTKFILAYLMNAALKTSNPPALLTSIRQLSERFSMSRYAIHVTLKKLQSVQIDGIPLIKCCTYNKEKAMQQLKERADVNKLYQTKDIDTKRAQILRRNLRDTLRLRDRERPIEIQILAYSAIKYDRKREGDFFFDVHIDMYKDNLSTTERVLLFFIQSRIKQNQNKHMQERCTLHVQTFANIFNFYIHYVHKTLKSLHDAGYIVYTDEKESQKINGWKNTYVGLTEKGTRTIQRFEDGSVQKYSRENRRKAEEEKQRLKEEQEKIENETQYPEPDQETLQAMKRAEAPTYTPNTARTQDKQTEQDKKREQREQAISEEQDMRNRQDEMLRQYHERNALNSGKEQEYFTTQEWEQFVDSKKPKPEKYRSRILKRSGTKPD